MPSDYEITISFIKLLESLYKKKVGTYLQNFLYYQVVGSFMDNKKEEALKNLIYALQNLIETEDEIDLLPRGVL